MGQRQIQCSLFSVHGIALALHKNPYWIFPLLTHKNDDFSTISVTELNYATKCNHSLSRAIILHDLIITQIFVKPGLNGLKAATPLVSFYLHRVVEWNVVI